MRINLRTLLMVITLIAICISFRVRQVGRMTNYNVHGLIKIPDQYQHMGPLVCNAPDPQRLPDRLSAKIEGVRIKMGVYGASFIAQGNYWTYKETVRDVREQMNAFADRNSERVFDGASIDAKILDDEGHFRTIYEQQFEVFPVKDGQQPMATTK